MSTPSPAIGQRWISDTETELGLGVLIEVEARQLTVLFPRSEETRVYSRINAPLSRIRFTPGDTVQDAEGNTYVVVSVDEKNDILRYNVKNADGVESQLSETRLSSDLHLSRPKDRLLAAQLDKNEWFDLRVMALQQRERLAQSPVTGLVGPRVGLIPHQFYIAHEVGTRLAPRVLLADEVGLGKTIEAGLIIHQQLLAGRSSRILILVPETLQHQWLVEMRRRFNLAFSLFDLERCAAIRESEGMEANPFLTEQCVLMSLGLLADHPDLHEAAVEAGWDLLVVDEAHHLGWAPDESSIEYDCVEDLAREVPGLLLLTATPEQLGVTSHFARLRLLDPARFHNLDAFLEEQSNYQPVADAAESLLGGTKPSAAAVKALSALIGKELAGNVDSEEGRKAALDALLDRHGMGRVLFRNTRDAIQGFPARLCLPAPLPCPIDWPHESSLAHQLRPEHDAEDEEWCEDDSRVAWLVELLKKHKREKILLICRTAPVVLDLEKYLRLSQGYRTTLFHEGMTLIERDRAAAYFADEETGAQILLCSEIGSEGRNFQFAHHLVLFDLPLNPDVLEQRIGRLDRIGQKETIKIHVPYFKETPQELLFRWYHEGLNAIEKISPTAQAVQDLLGRDLKSALQTKDEAEFAALLEKGIATRTELEQAMQDGRDRLLELHSCRKDVAQTIIDAVDEEDDSHALPLFMERVWSAFGVDHEDHEEEHTHILRPGDHMLTDAFPSLEADGMTVCFDRVAALSREDVHFLTWEHPMVTGVLDMFGRSEYGNTNIALIKNKGIKPGTVLMEVWFQLETIAPKALGLSRYLPQGSLRFLVDGEGRNLSKAVAHDTLRKQLQPLDRGTTRNIAKQQSALFETLINKTEDFANAAMPEIRQKAQDSLNNLMGSEIARLKALKEVNPSVRSDEIERLETLMAEGSAALERMKAVMDSIRIIIAA